MTKYREMQELSTHKENPSLSSQKRIYHQFPFFVGDEIKLHFDVKSWVASQAYQSQSPDNLSKPIHRFWNHDKSLVNLCCESIAKTLLEKPFRYSNRSEILPEAFNEAIDKKLEQVTHGIIEEKISSLTF